VRFLRRFAAVTLLVAVVTGVGLAWNRLDPSSLIGGLPGVNHVSLRDPAARKKGVEVFRPVNGRDRRVLVLPPGSTPPGHRPGNVIVVRLRPMDLGLNSMFERVDWPFLARTVVIESLVIAAVVFLDRIRRRTRRAWRSRASRRSATPEPAGGVRSALWRTRE
jgi:hypothetical protein